MPSPRVAVVTGSNKGIGFGIVKELCVKFDGIVYLTARDEKRGKAAQAELNKLGFSPKFHQLDIDNQASIDKFAKYIMSNYGGLDVLVNNAGIGYEGDTTVSFGDQAVNCIRINYFGTLAVCHALFPLLRPHARVSHVSSSLGFLGRVNGDEPQAASLRGKLSATSLTEMQLENLMNQYVKAAEDGNWKEMGWGSNSYCMSKAGISALTRIQQRAFNADQRADLVVNCCHPGYVATDLTSHIKRLALLSSEPIPLEEGVVAPSYLALLPPNISEPKGAFIWKDTTPIDWVNGPLPGIGY